MVPSNEATGESHSHQSEQSAGGIMVDDRPPNQLWAGAECAVHQGVLLDSLNKQRQGGSHKHVHSSTLPPSSQKMLDSLLLSLLALTLLTIPSPALIFAYRCYCRRKFLCS
ncbi:hypothetical protein V2G26_013410 [Clonostachys chloroleuca]